MASISEPKWLQCRTRQELQRTLGWNYPPILNTKEVFSAYNPMVPHRYVPEWQLDMKNRENIIKVLL